MRVERHTEASRAVEMYDMLMNPSSRIRPLRKERYRKGKLARHWQRRDGVFAHSLNR